MTFNQEVSKPSNRPVVVAQMQPKERLMSGWVNSSGTIYYIDTAYYVVNLHEDGIELTKAASSSVSSGEWFFDDSTKRLYVDVGADPIESFVSATYRLFFSNKSLSLPYDMTSGTEVPYVGIIDSTSVFKDEISSEDLIGIALSGSGSISFYNDGSWSSIYSKLFWETTSVNIYIGFDGLAASEYQLVYKGFVDSKSFSVTKVTFRLKDFIEKLRAEIPLSLFTSSDGDITEEGAPKRRIYGRAKVLGVSLDKIKDGFNLTGTFEKTSSTVITGTGSSLLSEASPEDKITLTNSIGEEVDYSIASIDSDTQMTISEEIDNFPSGSTIKINPNDKAVPYRNRTYFVCDHQMREPATTVSSGIAERFFSVADSSDLEAGDIITVDGVTRTIRNVSENNIIQLLTDLPSVPSNGDAVIKQAIFNVWADETLLVYPRDFSITNSSPSKIVLSESVEFNLAKQQPVTDGSSTALTFTNSSREVTGNIAFLDFFKPWDWIKSNDLTHTTWYQVLAVEETKLYLRTPYAGSNRTNDGWRKSVNLINDETRILIDAAGITTTGVKTGPYVKTASDVVKHLLEEQNLVVNAASFAQAKEDAPFLMSLAVPVESGGNRPKVRDILDLINTSVLGNLSENASREIVYKSLSPRKNEIDTIFRDDDLISYSIESTGKNVTKKVTARYRHEQANIFTGEPDAITYERVNSFIDYISDIEREEVIDIYLWHQADAELVAQRIALLRESTNTILKLKSNSLFLNKELNQLVYLELRDIYERFGTDADSNFIGVITLLAKSVNGTEVEISDLGGWYNKIATYASDGASDYSSSDEVARSKDGYYNSDSEIIDNSTQYRMNLYI